MNIAHGSMRSAFAVALLVTLFGTHTAQAQAAPYRQAEQSDVPSPVNAEGTLARGDVIVTDSGADAVFRVTPDGTITTIAAGFPLSDPVGVAIDGRGDFIVANYEARLVRVRLDGTVIVIASGPELRQISGVVIDDDGNFVTNRYTPPAVLRITTDGQVSTIAEGPPLLGPFNSPALAENGDIIVTDYRGSALHRVTQDGAVTTIASGPPFIQPNGVVIDENGDYIVSDRVQAVFRVTPDGIVSTIRRGSPFNAPDGIALGLGGNFIVPDSGGSAALYRVTPVGQIQAIAVDSPLDIPNSAAVVLALRGSVTGTVLSGGLPVQDAGVFLLEPSTPTSIVRATATDAAGQYEFSSVEPGFYVLLARLSDLQAEQFILVQEGQELTVDLDLQ